MHIYQVTDPQFAPYGQVVEGFDTKNLVEALAKTTQPAEGTAYVPSEPILEALEEKKFAEDHLYGGMPVQLGWCNGFNTKLNCLEYHRDSEFNLGTEDFILLLAKEGEIENGQLDTAKVKAFRVPAGVLVEVFASTLHYAPCHTDPAKGFRVMVALPAKTNTEMPENFVPVTTEDQKLWARNKWLLAHAESKEAAKGAYVGLAGENIDIASSL
ncbi:MAG: DUF4867 family protein [Firmicutes bacterium]|nr:DUF4867 family protein [Bacillota bacterium]